MNFTQSNHFVGSINMAISTSSSPYEGAELSLFIDRFESKYLTEVLGYKTAKDLIANMLVTTPPTSGIWFDLANGVEFTDSLGRLNKWVGFKTIGFNPIANYVYCMLQESRATSTTGVGEQKSNISNGTAVSSNQKVISAWNDMVEWNSILYDFLTINKASYPDYIGVQTTNYDFHSKINGFGI